MAIEVLSKIKSAEELAAESRRVAAIAAKDAIKLAQQENDELKDTLLTKARHDSIAIVESAQQEAKIELDALQDQSGHVKRKLLGFFYNIVCLRELLMHVFQIGS